MIQSGVAKGKTSSIRNTKKQAMQLASTKAYALTTDFQQLYHEVSVFVESPLCYVQHISKCQTLCCRKQALSQSLAVDAWTESTQIKMRSDFITSTLCSNVQVSCTVWSHGR